ncbi:hypothetical protein FT663_01559 [Candidozyma haemuli var. vulneris]|uniref:DASH complex subunit DAM1 n=1 Tax=Candidozyma haemuli TaxID=45357 RepID=A0A2V1AQ14_9ASCO|nr:hypothetical protein CXQ85_002104 [[Candida] haemuloni]KAF3990714.1 hypothetical protein FT662_02137 [[Candida] haemuloni var. vulneris]KAF3994328.1 hypothetical protein FT663_01559 [[Candida] haemuloni var. vulneris]PVH20317.1 hypothetical protein CXQ85_002104 [[Candida] haemuloni]
MSSRPNTPSHRRRESNRKSHRSSGLHLILPPSPNVHYPITESSPPLESDRNIERLENLADSIGQLKNNMTELSKIHEAVNSGFNEPFAGFLYGLFLTMFCNSFPGCPTYEQFESILVSRDNEQKVRDLQQRVNEAKQENVRLQRELAQTRPQRSTIASGSESARTPYSKARLQRSSLRKGLYPTPTKKRVTVAQDDTTTSESFVDTPANKTTASSKIPQPSSQVGTGPNLNQPSRYMRGLFDKTPSANIVGTSRRQGEKTPTNTAAKPSRRKPIPKQRPPFR